MSRFVRQQLLAFSQAPDKDNLVVLRELAASGKVTPVIDRSFALSDVPEAIRYVEVEHARAKVVLTL